MNTYSSKIKYLCIFKGTFCETVLKSGYIWLLFPVVFSNTVLERIIDSISSPMCFSIYYLILLDLSPRSGAGLLVKANIHFLWKNLFSTQAVTNS